MTITLKDLGLNEKSNDELYQTYLDALNEFVLPLTTKNVQGIILCGSFVKGKLQLGSDIDLVIIDNAVHEVEMQDKQTKGIKITIVTCSKQVLLEEISSEESKYVRRISHLLASGIPLDTNQDCEEIIAEASRVLSSQPPSLSGQELEEIQMFTSKHESLASDYYKRYNDLAFFTRFSFAMQEAIQIYFKLNKQIIPNWKWAAEDIKDKEFLTALLNFYSGSTKKEKYDNFLVVLEKLKVLVANYIM